MLLPKETGEEERRLSGNKLRRGVRVKKLICKLQSNQIAASSFELLSFVQYRRQIYLLSKQRMVQRREICSRYEDLK